MDATIHIPSVGCSILWENITFAFPAWVTETASKSQHMHNGLKKWTGENKHEERHKQAGVLLCGAAMARQKFGSLSTKTIFTSHRNLSHFWGNNFALLVCQECWTVCCSVCLIVVWYGDKTVLNARPTGVWGIFLEIMLARENSCKVWFEKGETNEQSAANSEWSE